MSITEGRAGGPHPDEQGPHPRPSRRPSLGLRARRLVTGMWLLISSTVAAAALALVGALNRYDAISYGPHAPLVRRLIPWRFGRLAALLPVATLAPYLLATPSMQAQIAFLLAGLAACEVYSICFHRESYIAAFEPRWLPADRSVLGSPAARRSDRRLHYLIRTQAIYVAPLIVLSLWIGTGDSPVAWLLFFAFVAKYVAPAWVDYEAYFHWDMHCQILTMKNAPSLTRIWRQICEWVLGPVVGSLPYLYSTEHLLIHHPQNAGPHDIHSPLPYRRTSILEFGHYLCKTVLILATSLPVITHTRCRGQASGRLLLATAATCAVTAAAITAGRPLGYWLAAAVVFRGANTAMAQYTWHGLHDGTGRPHPMSSTINWIPATVTANGDIKAAPSSPGAADGDDVIHPADGLTEHVPNPGSDWAFYDNYHLIHHLHPRAHFDDYPRLLATDAERITAFASPVITLDQYNCFFSNLMARALQAVAVGYQSPADLNHRTLDLLQRLEPWAPTRSRISIATDGQVSMRIDQLLSTIWRRCRRSQMDL